LQALEQRHPLCKAKQRAKQERNAAIVTSALQRERYAC
jgi:hypothetical protein